MLEKLLSEKSGILKWAVEGCLEWQKDGLNPPAVVLQETNRLFESQDALGEFIDSECVLDPMAEIEVTELWARYLVWCEGHGSKPAFKAVQWFSKNLCARDGIDIRRGTGGVRFFTGIRLKSDFTDGDSDASDANRAFSEKCSNNSFMRKVLQKPQNCVTCVTDQADNPASVILLNTCESPTEVQDFPEEGKSKSNPTGTPDLDNQHQLDLYPTTNHSLDRHI